MQRRDIRYQAAVVRDHHILLICAKDRETGATFWLLPGGGREADETVEACIQRELREETGLEVAVLGLLFTMPDIPEGIYDWLATYHCQVVSGTAQPGIEPEVDDAEHTTIQDVAWFDLQEPSSWNATIRQDRLTFPHLQQLRVALGYTVV